MATTTVETLEVVIRGNDQLTPTLQKAQSNLATWGSKLDRVGSRMTLAVTAPLVGLAGTALKVQADFEKTMNLLAASTGAPAAEMEKLNDLAKQLGADTVFSAGEAATAMFELAKAGIEVNDIMGGGIQGAMALAAAGQTDLAFAAETAATAMTMFGLAGEDVVKIADALAAGANESTASIESLAQALRQGGGMASNLGMTLEETVGVLAAFDQAGLKGSDAGTSLKTMLMRLTPQTEKQGEAFAMLNLQLYDAKGNFVGITEMARQLEEGTRGLSEEQRNWALQTIFGSDAMRAALVLMKEGEAGISSYIDAVSKQGAAQEMANAAMKGTAGTMEQLKGSLETAGLALGEVLAPAFKSIADALRGFADAFTNAPDWVKNITTVGLTVAALAGPVLKITGMFLKLGAAIKAAAVASGLLKANAAAGAVSGVVSGGGGAAATAAVGSRLAAIFNPVTAGLAALTAVILGAIKAHNDYEDSVESNVDNIREFNGSLDDVTPAMLGLEVSTNDLSGGFNTMRDALARYRTQQDAIVKQLGFVNPALEQWVAGLLKNNALSTEESNKVAGTIRLLEQFGGTLSKIEKQQLANLLAVGDTKRAFQLLNGWIDQVRSGLRGLSAILQGLSSSPAGQLPGGGQYRLPPEFAGGDGVPNRRRRRRRRNNTAAGGLVTGPQIRMVGEAGPEAIIPLSKLEVMLKRDKASVQSVHATDANREVRAFGKLLAESTEATKRNIEALEDAEYQVEFFGAALAGVSGEQEKAVNSLKAWFATLDDRQARIYRKQLNDDMREMVRYYREFFMGGMTNPGLGSYNTAGISQLNMNRLRSDDGSMAAAINRLERTVAASSSQPIVVRIDRKAFQRDVDYLERSRNL